MPLCARHFVPGFPKTSTSVRIGQVTGDDEPLRGSGACQRFPRGEAKDLTQWGWPPDPAASALAHGLHACLPLGGLHALQLALPQESRGCLLCRLSLWARMGTRLAECGVSRGPGAKGSDAFLPSSTFPQGRCIGATMEATLMNACETKTGLYERESSFAQHQAKRTS